MLEYLPECMELLDLKKCMPADEIYKVIGEASKQTKVELDQLGIRPGMSQEELISLFDKTSEKTFNELVGLNIFGPLVTMDMILQLCSGTDITGVPNSFAALSVDTILPDSEALPYANISFGAAVINIYAAGGCAVVTADFNRDGLFEYRRARNILSDWLEKKSEPEYADKLLSLAIFPVATNGQLSLIYHELAFAQGVPVDNNTYRLIMAFDGNQTQEIMNADIDMNELKATVEAEITRMEAEAKAEQDRAARQRTDKEFDPSETFVEDSFTPSYLKDGLKDTIDETALTEEHENPDRETEHEKGQDEDDSWMRFTR